MIFPKGSTIQVSCNITGYTIMEKLVSEITIPDDKVSLYERTMEYDLWQINGSSTFITVYE